MGMLAFGRELEGTNPTDPWAERYIYLHGWLMFYGVNIPYMHPMRFFFIF